MPRPIPTAYGPQERIRKSVLSRQQMKKKWDKKCKYEATETAGLAKAVGEDVYYGFSAGVDVKESTDNYVRLLDEGVVVDGDNYVYAVIKKGAIKEWYDAIPDDFVGSIDKDHNRSIELGSFTKKDLKLVEKADGRYGIDINVKLDKGLYAVKDLIRANNRFAVSVEFYSKVGQWITYSKATGETVGKGECDYIVPVCDKIRITGYAMVAEGKNAESYNEDLLTNASAEEGTEMNEEEVKAKLAEEETEAVEEKQEEVVETDATVETNEAEVEETAEEVEDTESTDAETPEEAADEGEADEEEAESEEEEFDAADKVEAMINEFKAQLAEKDKKIAELEAKFTAKSKKESTLNEKLAKLLNFSAEEPTTEEGAETTTSDKEETTEDAYAAALGEAFKNA